MKDSDVLYFPTYNALAEFAKANVDMYANVSFFDPSKQSWTLVLHEDEDNSEYNRPRRRIG
jgi:hypothetical protein